MKKASQLLLAFIAALAIVGCKPSVPSEYIQPGDMEDILYDYHIAEAMANQNGSQVEKVAYEDAVLRKHGVSRKEFDKSLWYYMRNSERLYAIYQNLSKRLENEAMAQGASVNDIKQFGENTASGDTTNIWRQTSSLLLVNSKPLNLRTFEIKADTSFHNGDKFILDFKSQYIIQQGMRNVVVVMSVWFSNDSVATKTCYASTNADFNLTVEDTERLGVKQIRGYFIMPQQRDGTDAETLKLFAAQSIRLVKMHTQQPKPIEPATTPADSTDSVRRPGPTMPIHSAPVPVPTVPTQSKIINKP